MIQNSTLSDMIGDAKILEGRLESAKTIIDRTISDADVAHAKLRSLVTAGLQDQGELRLVVQSIVDSNSFVNTHSHAILENRVSIIESIMAAASQATEERMANMERHIQVMCESMSEAVAQG